MQLVIIGSGNVATVLGKKLRQAGHRIVQVYSRNALHAARLASLLECAYTSFWDEIARDADAYIISLSDDALRNIGENLSLPGKLVIHTGGSVPMNVLLPVSQRCGVLYPLQSLRREIDPIPEIPLFIDARRDSDRQGIAELARSISNSVADADDNQRMHLHVGAVLVSNFTNHLYVLAEQYCRAEGVPFRMLLPLIRETSNRLSYTMPAEAQTGPAKRGDRATIEKHLALIDKYKDISEIYSLFTRQIKQFNQR